MKKLLTLLGMILIYTGCGGGGGNNCAFDPFNATNGPTGQQISSRWVCTGGGALTTFAIFDDETGASIATDGTIIQGTSFTWSNPSCDVVDFQGSVTGGGSISGTATNITGSTSQGTLTFVETDNGGPSFNQACTLTTH